MNMSEQDERLPLLDERPDGNVIPIGIKRRLFVSHFLSTWNFRGFEFGAVLFLASIFPHTLLPLSIYALVRAACAVIFSSALGKFIDNTNRLKVVRISIIWQRIVVVLSCAIFGYMYLSDKKVVTETFLYVLLAVTVFFACVERLCSTMNTVSIERDWVVVIAGGNESELRVLNSQMRSIDLFCKLLSPLIVALLDSFSTFLAIAVTFGVNAVSMVIEYHLIAKVYGIVPELSIKPSPQDSLDAENASESSSGSFNFVEDIKSYISQNAFLPSLSLSILYLTVLSFGGQMITYLLSVGYSSLLIGLIRVVSSSFEISATWMAPRLMQKIGPVRSGIWFLSFQMLCLGVSVFGFLHFRNPVWSASALVVGTVFSRVGLWGFDLCAQIVIQQGVSPETRGAFSTTEAALQNLFELCSYVSTLIFYRPADFKYPVLISIGAVYLAGALYARYVRQKRGHLIHIPKFISSNYNMI